jgi:UDP-glucose 4-epimerase
MILVTGGCGYIGSHVVKALTEAGEKVLVYDNLSQGTKAALIHGEELVVGDICDQGSLKQVFETHDIEAVIHLAALVNAAESNDKVDLYRSVNEIGSQNVYQAAVAAGVKMIMYSSSAAVYGTPVGLEPIQESAPLLPTNVYGETKLAGEKLLLDIAGHEVKYGIFRFFNVGGAEEGGRLGQSRESRAIMQRLFAVAAGDDDHIVISGHDYDTSDGTVVRDFIHVEDIALAFVLGLNNLRKGSKSFTLNLGSGESHTIGEVIKEVGIVTGKNIPLIYGPRIKGDISYSLSDISLVQKVLGWEPVHTLRLIVRDGWNAYKKLSLKEGKHVL